MNRGDKIRAAHDRRVQDWESIPSIGMDGKNTKLVRLPCGKGSAAFHKPGSKSGRKGYGKRKAVTKK